MSGELFASQLDPLGFVANELSARGALVERDDRSALAVLPPPVARSLELSETLALADAPGDHAIGCGLGSPLLDRLVAAARATVPVASVTSLAEAPRAAVAERLAERLVVRNGVADVLGVAHASATYLAGIFTWTAEADDRYQGMTITAANAATGAEPDAAWLSAITALIAEADPGVTEERNARGATGGAAAVSRRAALAIGPRLDEVGAAVARRRDRERARIDEYFASLIAEAKRPRRQVARSAIDARVAALHAEHTAKLRDLTARYSLRVHLEPIALVAIAMRVAEIRIRLRRRKGEREIALHVPPFARTPDALACVGCPGTTRAPLLCDDALHVLCETCAPEAGGRPRCPACRPGRGAKPAS
ncbi:MAG TPA: zinc finger, RING-type domain-containing protein [Kofleriaceae bacterium]|nr:zinc finger, RING-type domain-containing protein [Kofleriaceae bacterium]